MYGYTAFALRQQLNTPELSFDVSNELYDRLCDFLSDQMRTVLMVPRRPLTPPQQSDMVDDADFFEFYVKAYAKVTGKFAAGLAHVFAPLVSHYPSLPLTAPHCPCHTRTGEVLHPERRQGDVQDGVPHQRGVLFTAHTSMSLHITPLPMLSATLHSFTILLTLPFSLPFFFYSFFYSSLYSFLYSFVCFFYPFFYYPSYFFSYPDHFLFASLSILPHIALCIAHQLVLAKWREGVFAPLSKRFRALLSRQLDDERHESAPFSPALAEAIKHIGLSEQLTPIAHHSPHALIATPAPTPQKSSTFTRAPIAPTGCVSRTRSCTRISFSVGSWTSCSRR